MTNLLLAMWFFDSLLNFRTVIIFLVILAICKAVSDNNLEKVFKTVKLSIVAVFIVCLIPSKMTTNIILSAMAGNIVMTELKENSFVKKGLVALEKELDKYIAEKGKKDEGSN